MSTRKAEVLFIGDAASIVRAASQAESAVSKSSSGITKSHTTIGNSFTGMVKKVAGAAIGFGAAYAGIAGAEKAVSATETLAHTTLTLSKNFGLTTKAASEWGAQAQARGIDGTKLTMGFKTLSSAIMMAGTGSKTSVAEFDKLGISASTLKGHGNDLQFMLGKVSDGLRKLPPGTQKSALEAKLFGRSWQQLAPLLRDGSKAMNDQLGLADKYGATFSGKGAKGLEDMIQAQRESKLATLGLQVAFGTFLAPALTKVIEGVTGFVAGIRNGTGVGGQFANVISSIIAVIAPLVDWFIKHKTITLALAAAIGTLIIGIQAVTVATTIWTAVSEANPWVLLGTVVAALAAGLVVLEAKTHFLTDAWNFLKGAFDAVVSVIKGAISDVLSAVGTAWHAIESATSSTWDAIKSVVTAVWEAIKGAASSVFGAIKGAVTGVWSDIKGVTSDVWNAVKSFLSGAWHDIKDVAGTVWGGISDAVTGAIHGAIGIVKGVIGDFKGWLSGAWKDISDGVSGFAGLVSSGISSAFNGAVNLVIGFINDIIGVIDIIPGVNIGKLKPIGTTSAPTSGGGKKPPAGTSAPGHQPHAQALAVGGKINRPMVMVGEEAPAHPEYVIATNPSYRERNLSLWQAAGHSLGIPGFKGGGMLGAPGTAKSTDGITGILSQGANFLLNQLPDPTKILPSWLSGLGSSIIGDATSFIKKQVGDFLSTLIGNGPNPESAKQWTTTAMKIAGVSGDAWLGGLLRQEQHESSFNPKAINLTDINAKEGHPSKGIMQVIDPTFATWHKPGLNDIWNPVDNIVAAIRYIIGNYGHGSAVDGLQFLIANGGNAYRFGGVIGEPPFGGARALGGPVSPGYSYRVGENGPETFVPNQRGVIMSASQSRGGSGGINIEKAYFTGAQAAKATVDRLAFRAAIGTA